MHGYTSRSRNLVQRLLADPDPGPGNTRREPRVERDAVDQFSTPYVGRVCGLRTTLPGRSQRSTSPCTANRSGAPAGCENRASWPRPLSAALPFTRLRSDGIWTLDHDVPHDTIGPLTAHHVTGQLDPTLEAALAADHQLLASAARALVESQFPETIAPDVLTAVGLDPGTVLHAADPARPNRHHPTP